MAVNVIKLHVYWILIKYFILCSIYI